MNVTLVEINIKPERVDEFLTVFRANHEGAIKEPGNQWKAIGGNQAIRGEQLGVVRAVGEHPGWQRWAVRGN